MKKTLTIAVALAVIGSAAFAGFDQYNSKNYTTVLVPTHIATEALTASNAVPADVAGLPGNGCMVFSYAATNGAGAILSFQIQACATSNGTFAVITNSSGSSSWAYTNSAGFGKVLLKPNTVSRYLRVVVTPTGVTNGVCGAVLVTE